MATHLIARDHEYVPILADVLPRIVIEDPRGRIAFSALLTVARRECRRRGHNTFPYGTLRRVLRELGYRVCDGATGEHVYGIRMAEKED